MKKFLLILLLPYCSACPTTLKKAPDIQAVIPNDAMNDVAIFALSLADTPYQFGGNSPEN